MDVFNRPGFLHQHTMGMDVAGREFLLFVIKGTMRFPDKAGGRMTRAETQTPIVYADEHTGEPGQSATLRETDFAFRKPHCEVVLQGTAYAPEGKPTARVQVGIRVGRWQKTIMVVGRREWRVFGPSLRATDPVPFAREPIGYDRAFGGVDRSDPDDDTPAAYMPNPHGQGFGSFRNQSMLNGQRLPTTEEPGEEITSPYGDYRPMSFGPVWRGHPDRLKHGGTYDQKWQDEVFPFLPTDFDERYYQQTLPDQWIEPLRGGEAVTLLNLTPMGRESFRLPDMQLPLKIFRGWEEAYSGVVHPDTLIFDTEARTLSAVWRAQVPIKRIISEFTEAWIGRPRRGMERARAKGKAYRRFDMSEDA